MIRVNFLLFFVVFSSSLFCQQPDEPVLNLTYIDQWDSETNDWVRNQRIEYMYDENLNQTEGICYYQPDLETNDWIAYWRFVYAYDAEGKRTEIFYYYWDPQANRWVNNSRSFYTYDGYGNRTNFESYYWDPQSNDWTATSRETGTYNGNGMRTEGYYYYWDPEMNDWINYKRYTTGYDTYGNPSQDTYYYWDHGTSDWRVDRQIYYNYDTDGNRTQYESHCFDLVSDAWHRNLLINEAYDGNGNRTEGLYYHFDSPRNDWLGHRRYVYTYDGNGNRTGEVNYRWDSNTNNWMNYLRSLITIDENGNPSQEVHYLWDSQTHNWEYLKKVEHYWSGTVKDTTTSLCGPCLDETFTDQAGTFSDNSCDEDYDNFANCRKLIQVPDADYINLVFTEFNIEEGYDFVRVYDGTSTGDVLLGEFTGTSLPDMVTSTGGSMLVHFSSDYSVTRSGWSAEYTSGEGPVCVNETFFDESGIVYDNSGDLDYMINADCQKLIVPEDVSNITLTFTEFILENGNDYVRVYDGSTTGDELLGEFTGTSLPDPITSSGGSMLIHFTSNGSVNASGWAATYTSRPSPCGRCLDETFAAPAGIFSDNSCDGDYDNFADCRKLIQVPDADYINLVFTEFNIEEGYDYVRVYDGPSTGDVLLGEFTGTSLPDMVTSTGGSMLVHFISDYSEIRSGWSVEYISGKIESNCINETFTAESGIVDDNSGDLDYGINADCRKLIVPGDVMNITLTFTEFALENGNDYVRVYDGSTTGDQLLGEFTGTSLPDPVTSSGGTMLILFTSNGSVGASGWAASYTSTPTPSTPCRDETFTAPAGAFSDNSSDADYENFADCRKLIQVPDADYINLVFTEFNIDEGHDYVRVYDGTSTGDVLLGEFTGTSLPAMVTSTGGSMLVHFTSDNSITGPGWRAEFISEKIESACTNETFTDESGNIDDNSGDLDYGINADCRKLIVPGDVMNITLTFTEFALEDGNDYVRVYDGSTTGDDLLGEFTGKSLPDPITSSGGSMLIHFTSNGSVSASGWAASYTSTPTPSIPCRDETFTAPAGSFSDNSYDEDYENLADCRKLIQVPDADYIYLVFTEFNIDEGYDYVRVYDGTSTGDVLLGEFTGTSLPAMVTSTGGSMLVHFTSDNSITGPGWRAEYSSGKIETTCADETFTTKSGIIDDKSGDLDYGTNADCRKLIAPGDVLNITLTFNKFTLEDGNDYVRVYDGSTTGDDLLGEFTGTSLPNPITSTGSTMLVHFTTNGSVNASGWAASYASTSSLCDPCMNEIFKAAAGTVSDNSRDANYENFADCRKLIQVKDADYINLVFTDFNIDEGNDYVRVYDGQTIDDILLGEFTGTLLPKPITSSGSTILIHFTSNGSVNAPGWAASYKGIKETTVTEIPIITGRPDKESILVYPNPVESYVTVEILNNRKISKVEIFDLYGRILRITDNINNSSVTLQRGDLQRGIYILRIHAADIYTRDIIIW
ncbi:MAG: hypothetical protein AMS26_13590 [Bacteroides sp. SM23_62]|nr:MAG: hypothetical protein AMS26_13590 [Bacteroides sp. SM23_62]